MKNLICEFVLYSEEQLIQLGHWFTSCLRGHETVALCGDLGSGKTTFTKGVAHRLSAQEEIISPTFVLLREYPHGIYPLLHYDIYRLENVQELLDIGFLEQLDDQGIKMVEWGDKFPSLMQYYDWKVEILIPSPELRTVRFYQHD